MAVLCLADTLTYFNISIKVMRNANNQPVVGILAVTRRPVYSHWIDDVRDASQPYTNNKQTSVTQRSVKQRFVVCVRL